MFQMLVYLLDIDYLMQSSLSPFQRWGMRDGARRPTGSTWWTQGFNPHILFSRTHSWVLGLTIFLDPHWAWKEKPTSRSQVLVLQLRADVFNLSVLICKREKMASPAVPSIMLGIQLSVGSSLLSFLLSLATWLFSLIPFVCVCVVGSDYLKVQFTVIKLVFFGAYILTRHFL